MGGHSEFPAMVSFVERFAKAFWGAAGALTPAAAVGVLALFGVHLDAVTVAGLLGLLSPLLGTAAVVAAPANTPKPPPAVAIAPAPDTPPVTVNLTIPPVAVTDLPSIPPVPPAA